MWKKWKNKCRGAYLDMSEAWASNELNGRVVMTRLVRKPDGHSDLALGSGFNSYWLSIQGASNNWDFAMWRVGSRYDYGALLNIWSWPNKGYSYESPVRDIRLSNLR